MSLTRDRPAAKQPAGIVIMENLRQDSECNWSE